MIYATVISPVIIIHKQNSSKQSKWKLRIQKEIEEYSGEIFRLDKMSKGVKRKTRKARKKKFFKIKRKYEIISIDMNLIIKVEAKNPTKDPAYLKI